MKKVLLNILVMICCVLSAQNNNEHVREINYGVLGLLDDYANASKLWGPTDANNFYKLFDSNAEVVNDISQSLSFGQQMPFMDYINVIKEGRSSSMIRIDLNLLQINAISGDSKGGSVSVIAEKTISTKFQDIGLLEGEEFGDKKQKIEYDNQAFVLKFEIDFYENTRLIELLKKQESGDITDYEIDDLAFEPKFIYKITDIQLHEKKNKVLPVLTYIKDFPYLSKGTLVSFELPVDETEKNIEIDGCTNLNALNFNPNATKDDGTCLLVNLNQSNVEQKGSQIRYFLYDGDEQVDEFTLNNIAYSKGKFEDYVGDYQKLVFKQRIDYKISYNSSISKSGFSTDFIDEKGLVNNVDYSEKINVSLGVYPYSKTLAAGFGYKLGFKISSVQSEISMSANISPYNQIVSDAQLGGIGVDYNRLYEINNINEVINLNRNSFYISAQLNYNLYNPSDELSAYIYSKFNLSILNLRSATYTNNATATILGAYSINEETNEFQDYDNEADVTFGAGVFDFGSHNISGEGDLSALTTSLDMSSISLGLEFNFKRYGLYFEIDTELISSKDLFEEKQDVILEYPLEEQVYSLTSITNNTTKNTYFSIGLNFKF